MSLMRIALIVAGFAAMSSSTASVNEPRPTRSTVSTTWLPFWWWPIYSLYVLDPFPKNVSFGDIAANFEALPELIDAKLGSVHWNGRENHHEYLGQLVQWSAWSRKQKLFIRGGMRQAFYLGTGKNRERKDPKSYDYGPCGLASWNEADGVEFYIDDEGPLTSKKLNWWALAIKHCVDIAVHRSVSISAPASYFRPEYNDEHLRICDLVKYIGVDSIVTTFTIWWSENTNLVDGPLTYDVIFGQGRAGIETLMREYPDRDAYTFKIGLPLKETDAKRPGLWLSPEVLREYQCRANFELGWTGGYSLWNYTMSSTENEMLKVLTKRCDDPRAVFTTTTTRPSMQEDDWDNQYMHRID